MQRVWNDMVSFFQGMESEGSYYGIGLLAVLFCLIYEGREKRHWRCVAIAVCTVVVLLWNPLTARAYEMLLGRGYPLDLVSLAIPLLPFLAYAGTMLVEEGTKGRPMRDRVLLVAGLVVVFMAAGTMVPFGNGKPEVGMETVGTADERCIEAVSDAAKELQDIGQEPLLVAPKEIMETIRRYDGSIELIYGRDLWQTDALAYLHETYPEEIILLCQRMESSEANVAQTAEAALALGCNLIVCKESLSDAFMEYQHLELYYEAQELYLYIRR